MICFPLDNTEYSAVAPGSYLSSRTRGVFSAEENLQVYPAGGMNIAVRPGIAWLKKAEFWGVSAYSEREELRAIAAADGRLARIDAVCLRLDKTLNKAEIVIKQGEPAASPVAAPIERSSNYDELYLATVRVGAGVYTITQADITDQRLNEAYCGLMRDGVTGIPTAQLYEQAEAMLEMIRAELANINSGSEFMLKTEYAPDATARVNAAGLLEITSTYQKTTDNYAVLFNLPAGYSPVDASGTPTKIIVDGSACEILSSVDGRKDIIASNEGQPVFLLRDGNFIYIIKQGAGSDILAVNLFVDSMMGNDLTGDGSSTKPYKTVAFAVSKVPAVIPRFQGWNIKLTAGQIFPEDIYIDSFTGPGSLTLTSTSAELAASVATVVVNNCYGPVTVRYLTATGFTSYRGVSVTQFAAGVSRYVHFTSCTAQESNVTSGAAFLAVGEGTSVFASSCVARNKFRAYMSYNSAYMRVHSPGTTSGNATTFYAGLAGQLYVATIGSMNGPVYGCGSAGIIVKPSGIVLGS